MATDVSRPNAHQHFIKNAFSVESEWNTIFVLQPDLINNYMVEISVNNHQSKTSNS